MSDYLTLALKQATTTPFVPVLPVKLGKRSINTDAEASVAKKQRLTSDAKTVKTAKFASSKRPINTDTDEEVPAAKKQRVSTKTVKTAKTAKTKPVKAIETFHRTTNVAPTEEYLADLRGKLARLTGDPLGQSRLWKKQVARYAIVDSMYSLPTCFFSLGVPHLTMVDVCSRLTFMLENSFTPAAGAAGAAGAAAGASSLTRVCYQEDGEWLRVPRAFGIDLYGLPQAANVQTSQGLPMNQSLVFEGTLSETALRPQVSADAALRKQVMEEMSGILQLPCGCGKTRTAVFSCLKLGRKVLWISHLSELLAQAKEAFETMVPGIKVGWIQENRCEVEGMDVVMASAQTLLVRTFSDALRDEFGTVVWDEVHHVASTQYSTIPYRFRAHNYIGLSATPRRSDTTTDLIFHIMGKVAFKCERPPQKVQVRLVTYNNKRNEKEIKCKIKHLAYTLLKRRLAHDWCRNNAAVDQIIRCSLEGRRVIVFTDTHKSMDTLAGLLAKRTQNWRRPLDVVEYSGRIKSKERAEKLQHNVVITSPSMMKEGVDARGFDTIVYVFLQGDPEQSSGRVLRTEVENMENVPLLVLIKDPFGILLGLANKNCRFFKQLGYEFSYETVDAPHQDSESDEEDDEDEEDDGDDDVVASSAAGATTHKKAGTKRKFQSSSGASANKTFRFC